MARGLIEARSTADSPPSSRPLAELEVQVHEPGEQVEGDVKRLVAWIERQEAVRAVVHDADDGTIVLRYDTRKAPERLLRGAVMDRLSAIRNRPDVVAKRVEVKIAHEVPGRVRLKVSAAPPEAVERLASFIATLAGVERARASPGIGSVVVMFDERVTTTREIVAAISGALPTAWPAAQPVAKPAYFEGAKAAFGAAVLAGAITGVVPAPVMLGAVAISAIPPFRRAITSLAHGHVNVDVMDAVAIGVCLARAEPVTAAVITALLAVGDLILDRTHVRARTAISQLMKLDDGEAYVLASRDAVPKKVHPRELVPGSLIIIYPGARVPADGIIVEGALSVDEKALTGESVPRDRRAGEHVMAASVAVHGQAIVEVERAGGDTIAARIVQILEGAGAKPMTLQRNAERYADRLVLPSFGAAGAAWALSGLVDRATSVLITDFGTGVRVAVPTAALASMTVAARQGVLVKGASFLERLAEADTIVFDKTGTLTLGLPEVTRIVATNERYSQTELIAYAAAVEGNQSHPVADALRRHAQKIGAPDWEPDAQTEVYKIGLGLEARVNDRLVSIGSARMMRDAGVDPSAGDVAIRELALRGESSVLLAVDGELVGVIGYADAARPESAGVVARLKAGGRRRVILLSGDARAPVEAIATALGIDEAIADVLPEDKAEHVRRLKASGRKVAMVGDGINDAPALAVADIGISLHGGTDVALETADVVLLEGGLERLPVIFDVADHSMRRVKQVVGMVIVPNVIAIAAGAFGIISPAVAAIINNGSTIAAAIHAIAPVLTTAKLLPPPAKL
jgi:heavy metal translocating P-type ATPase